jgi:hypothetical protein
MKKFNLLTTHRDDYYIDYELADNSLKGARRVWVITHSMEDNKWWGMLRRAETPTSNFDDGVYLPHKMVNAIRLANRLLE